LLVKKNVLFICVHNSARSQMAAALLNQICGEFFQARSAGLEPGTLNPLAVEALREIGIDISRARTQSVFDVFKSGQLFAYAITVCSESQSKGCPVFAGVTKRLHWSFPDPSQFTGTHEEKMARTREVLDQIRARIENFCEEHCALEARP
jgi:arsenate reductase (thioredoxin)